MKMSILITVICSIIITGDALKTDAQLDKQITPPIVRPDTAISDTVLTKSYKSDDFYNQMDVVDLVGTVFPDVKRKKADSSKIKNTKFRMGGPVPAAGFTLSTGFAVAISANGSFCTDKDANRSSILSECAYTQYKQLILPLQTSIWTKGNKYNLITDWHYLYYPSYTYGLGGYTTLDDGYIVNYHAIKLRNTILRQIYKDLYAGPGYNIDYFWNITEVNPPKNKLTDFERFGCANTEIASSLTFNISYDTRQNSINPEGGSFVNIIYDPHPVSLGNPANWQSLIFDLRKYYIFPANSENILAFWSYDWFTLAGKPPYLELPYTGGDEYGNFGRGYVIGRYRGANVVYLEGEYRFRILNNGLISGVVFANAQSFTEQTTGRYETISPAWGPGIRLKFNKYSRTNACLDYGFGIKGSKGFFVNLGEVF